MSPFLIQGNLLFTGTQCHTWYVQYFTLQKSRCVSAALLRVRHCNWMVGVSFMSWWLLLDKNRHALRFSRYLKWTWDSCHPRKKMMNTWCVLTYGLLSFGVSFVFHSRRIEALLEDQSPDFNQSLIHSRHHPPTFFRRFELPGSTCCLSLGLRSLWSWPLRCPWLFNLGWNHVLFD